MRHWFSGTNGQDRRPRILGRGATCLVLVGMTALVLWPLVRSAGQSPRQDSASQKAQEEPSSQPPVTIEGQSETPTKPATEGEAAGKTEEKPASRLDPPDWLADARWYSIHVPRFHNGEPSNDPPGTVSFQHPWPARTLDATDAESDGADATDALAVRPYGGDLQGVARRFGYLRSLGVNTLYLSAVFARSGKGSGAERWLRHVEDVIARPAPTSLTDSTNDDRTASDRFFVEFVLAAHQMGFRVIVEIDLAPLVGLGNEGVSDTQLLAAARRWMDPDGDGSPNEGVDGWALTGAANAGALAQRWRRVVGRVNPMAAVIDAPAIERGADDQNLSRALMAALQAESPGSALQKLLSDKAAGWKKAPLEETINKLHIVAGPGAAVPGSSGKGPGVRMVAKDSERVIAVMDRWRLATILAYFSPGAPLVRYGDEVGVPRGAGVFAHPPMWWSDLEQQPPPDGFRGDALALIRRLNALRDRFPALRRGTFELLPLNQERKLLAVRRSIPGEDVVLVINYGDEKQQVAVPIGQPGDLVAALSPQVRPLPPRARRGQPEPPPKPTLVEPIQHFRMGGSRQFVGAQGTVELWVDGRSIRVVVLNDTVGQR